MVTVVIPNFNGAHWLRKCLPSLERSTFRDFEVVVVDNGSSDDSEAVVAQSKLPARWLASACNEGFAKAANRGISAARSPLVLLLNNDTEVRADFLQKLTGRMAGLPASVAAVQPLMVQMDDPTAVDDAGNALSWYGLATKTGHGEDVGKHATERYIFSPSGGATLYRADFLRQMNGFDEGFGSYLEDVDLGLRGQLAGFRYLFCPEAVVWHKGHGSAMPARRYVRLMTKNRLLLFLQNIPLRLLVANVFRLAYSQLYFLLAYARPGAVLLGYADLALQMRRALRQRQAVRCQTVLSHEQVRALLGHDFPRPHLPRLLADFAYNAIFQPLTRRSRPR